MFRKWGLRLLIVMGAALMLFFVFAAALQVPAVGKTIGSAKTCSTCHVMNYEAQTLQRSAHRDLACLDCHSPHGFLEKPVEEIKSASRHLYIFMTGSTPDVITPQHSSREIVQGNCAGCHAATVGKTHAADKDLGRFCFDCHRDVPHGRPLRN